MGMDSLRVISNRRLAWLNVTDSGNESSTLHKYDTEWKSIFALFNPLPGARQIFDLSIKLAQTSCGMCIPYYEYTEDRELLNDWAQKTGNEGLKKYWLEINQLSIDGIPTNNTAKNS
jgi:hypothetical protein